MKTLPDEHFICIDCGSDEMLKDYFGKAYMVLGSIWVRLTKPEERSKLICLKCLEKRNGKPFVRSEFNDSLLNGVNDHIRTLKK